MANHLKWVIMWVIIKSKSSINPVFTEDFLVRVVIQNFLKKPVISTVFKADE